MIIISRNALKPAGDGVYISPYQTVVGEPHRNVVEWWTFYLAI